MATVIDQFIVKYTLDTKDLDKGTRETEKKLKGLRDEAKDTGTALGDSIEAGAKRASGSFGVLGSMLGKGGMIGLAIGSIAFAGKVIDDKMFKVAQSLRRLGIDSKNFNIAASGMRNLQYASEMAGGSMEDATQSVADLSKSLFDLKFNGQVSQSLIMLSRLGVQFQDSYGRARDFNDVMLDTADAISRAKAAGRMTDAEGYQFAVQAGMTGGMANLVNAGSGAVRAEMARQGGRRQVQQGDMNAGNRWVNTSLNIGQATEADLGNAMMSEYGNARASLNDGIVSAGETFKDAAETFGDAVTRFFNGSTSSRAAPAAGVIQRGGAAPYASAIAAASAKYGIPEEVLTGLLRTESGFNPSASNPSGAKGIAQLMPATGRMLGVTPGADANADINAAADYLSRLRKAGKAGGFSDTESLMYAVDAYHSGMGNIASGKNLGPESMAYAGKVFAGTSYENQPRPWMGGGSSVNVQADVNIYAQNVDAQSVSSSVADLTKRKLLTAHAERGTQ